MGRLIIEMRGRKFGRLSPLNPTGNGRWLCVCDCGEKRDVDGNYLRRGIVVSCGCLKREKATKHRRSKHPLYGVWSKMLSRCLNKADPAYPRYGGRGIKVCERWRDIRAFLADMGPRPAGMTLERTNNDGPYAPDNCVWASRIAQANNRRSGRMLTLNGRTCTLADWARLTGLKRSTIMMRIEHGWDVERALCTPAQKRHC